MARIPLMWMQQLPVPCRWLPTICRPLGLFQGRVTAKGVTRSDPLEGGRDSLPPSAEYRLPDRRKPQGDRRLRTPPCRATQTVGTPGLHVVDNAGGCSRGGPPCRHVQLFLPRLHGMAAGVLSSLQVLNTPDSKRLPLPLGGFFGY